MNKNKFNFTRLVPKIGGDYYNKILIAAPPKDPDILLNSMTEAYGAETLHNMMESNIGQYVFNKGIIHAANMNVGRAIPWIQDGLKRAERRVLFIMHKEKLYHGKTDKVAGIVGAMIQYVYPHGDAGAADTIYRIGRRRSMNTPYIEPAGSFGNMFDMEAASPRYAGGSLSDYAYDCFFSDRGEIGPLYDQMDNYKFDGKEPIYLVTKYPNIIMQWNSGIGKGASSYLCGFNSKDAFKAVLALLDDPDAPIDIYPDTPVPNDITNKAELKGCFDMRKFKVHMRAQYEIIADKRRDNTGKIVDKHTVVFVSLPYTITGQRVLKEITNIVKEDAKRTDDKRLPEVINTEVDVNDDTDSGIRIIVEYEKGYDPNALAEKLMTSTSLGYTIGVKYALSHDNSVVEFTPREVSLEWISMRFDQKRRYYNQKVLFAARERSKYDAITTILQNDNVDRTIKMIRQSKSDEEALKALQKAYDFSTFQALQVLAIKISNLTKLNIDDSISKRDKAMEDYKKYRKMLSSENAIKEEIRSELKEGLEKYGRKRMSTLCNITENNGEDGNERKRIFYTPENYITIPGDGNIPEAIHEQITSKFKLVEVANQDRVILISTKGNIKILDGYAFNSSGHLISSDYIGLPDLVSIIPIPKNSTGYDVVLVTEKGYGKLLSIDECTKSTKGRLITVPSDDNLVSAILYKRTDSEHDMVMITQEESATYVSINDIPRFKRSSYGNKLIKAKNPIVTGAYGYTSKGMIAIYGEGGYVKVLDHALLPYNKRKQNSISFKDRTIIGVVSLPEGKGEGIIITPSGKVTYTTEVNKTRIDFRTSDNTKYSIKISNSISAPVRLFKLSRKEYYSL